MFLPVEIRGRYLVDGMLSHPVPTRPLREMGADRVLAIHLKGTWANGGPPRHLFDVIGQSFAIAQDAMASLWRERRRPHRRTRRRRIRLRRLQARRRIDQSRRNCHAEGAARSPQVVAGISRRSVQLSNATATSQAQPQTARPCPRDRCGPARLPVQNLLINIQCRPSSGRWQNRVCAYACCYPVRRAVQSESSLGRSPQISAPA